MLCSLAALVLLGLSRDTLDSRASLSAPRLAAAARASQSLSCAALSPPPHVLVYNRYTKSASTTMVKLLQQLARVHGFAVASLEKSQDAVTGDVIEGFDLLWVNETGATEHGYQLTAAQLPADGPSRAAARACSGAENRTDAAKTIACLLEAPVASALVGHFPFPGVIDPRVAYINIIREPVSHCTSLYYYIKRPHWKPAEQRSNVTVDECWARAVAGPGIPCHCAPLGSAWFLATGLGHSFSAAHARAQSGDESERRALLALAKSNVDKHYAAVGILPDLRGFVRRLERILPSFFAGAGDVLAALPPENVGRFDRGYVEPSAETRARILASRSIDAEMYAHVQRRWETRRPCEGDDGET